MHKCRHSIPSCKVRFCIPTRFINIGHVENEIAPSIHHSWEYAGLMTACYRCKQRGDPRGGVTG